MRIGIIVGVQCRAEYNRLSYKRRSSSGYGYYSRSPEHANDS